jgi:cytochrome c oxidase subunit 3
MSGAVESEAFRDAERERQADAFGMWIFIGSEAMLFGAVMLVYLTARMAHPEGFGEASSRLSLLLGTVNTAVLITSSLAMALADLLVKLGRRRAAAWALAATALLGLAFLAVKGVEYADEVREGLAPVLGLPFALEGADPRGAQLFFELYFASTGLHAAHLIGGLAAIATVLAMWRRSTDAACLRRTRAVGLYWHFVDIVWVFLFPLLYLVHR